MLTLLHTANKLHLIQNIYWSLCSFLEQLTHHTLSYPNKQAQPSTIWLATMMASDHFVQSRGHGQSPTDTEQGGSPDGKAKSASLDPSGGVSLRPSADFRDFSSLSSPCLPLSAWLLELAELEVSISRFGLIMYSYKNMCVFSLDNTVHNLFSTIRITCKLVRFHRQWIIQKYKPFLLDF